MQHLRDLLGEVTSKGYKIEGVHMGDGKQKRVEVGNISAAAGSSCEACTNLSSHMGDFTVLMPMDMEVRSNWEVMTRLVPKTAGATAAHQSKLDGGVKHLNISGVPPSAYYPQTLHIDLRATAVVWKKTYECLLAEGVETAVKQICALSGPQHSVCRSPGSGQAHCTSWRNYRKTELTNLKKRNKTKSVSQRAESGGHG